MFELNSPQEKESLYSQYQRYQQLYGYLPSFPQPEKYGCSQAEIREYLIDKQIAIDKRGSSKMRHTTLGVSVLLCVWGASLIPPTVVHMGKAGLFAAIAIGLLLSGIILGIRDWTSRQALRKIANPHIEEYLDAIYRFQP